LNYTKSPIFISFSVTPYEKMIR